MAEKIFAAQGPRAPSKTFQRYFFRLATFFFDDAAFFLAAAWFENTRAKILSMFLS